MSGELPWFRLWTDIIDDHKIRMLAFEDRWHFVALLSLKRSGYLDRDQTTAIFRRGMEIKMGVTGVDLDNLKQRLTEVELIGDDWCPLNWDKRQARSDNSTERVRKYREKQKNSNVTHDETLQKRSSHALEKEKEEEIEKDQREASKLTPAQHAHIFQGADEAITNLYLQKRLTIGKPVDTYGLDKTRRILALCQTPAERSEALENSGSDRHGQVEERHLPERLRKPPQAETMTLRQQIDAGIVSLEGLE